MKSKNASKFEIVFVILMCYPQTKTIKFLWEYICDKNETRLNQKKDDFDKHIGNLEPFLESAFQVSH